MAGRKGQRRGRNAGVSFKCLLHGPFLCPQPPSICPAHSGRMGHEAQPREEEAQSLEVPSLEPQRAVQCRTQTGPNLRAAPGCEGQAEAYRLGQPSLVAQDAHNEAPQWSPGSKACARPCSVPLQKGQQGSPLPTATVATDKHDTSPPCREQEGQSPTTRTRCDLDMDRSRTGACVQLG